MLFVPSVIWRAGALQCAGPPDDVCRVKGAVPLLLPPALETASLWARAALAEGYAQYSSIRSSIRRARSTISWQIRSR